MLHIINTKILNDKPTIDTWLNYILPMIDYNNSNIVSLRDTNPDGFVVTANVYSKDSDKTFYRNYKSLYFKESIKDLDLNSLEIEVTINYNVYDTEQLGTDIIYLPLRSEVISPIFNTSDVELFCLYYEYLQRLHYFEDYFPQGLMIPYNSLEDLLESNFENDEIYLDINNENKIVMVLNSNLVLERYKIEIPEMSLVLCHNIRLDNMENLPSKEELYKKIKIGLEFYNKIYNLYYGGL